LIDEDEGPNHGSLARREASMNLERAEIVRDRGDGHFDC